jgi:hypothetical protein
MNYPVPQVSSEEYRKNHDRIFGKKPIEPVDRCYRCRSCFDTLLVKRADPYGVGYVTEACACVTKGEAIIREYK